MGEREDHTIARGLHAQRLIMKEIKCRCGNVKWRGIPLVVILFNALADDAQSGTQIQQIGTQFMCCKPGCGCFASLNAKGEWKVMHPDDAQPEEEGGGESGGGGGPQLIRP